MIDIKGDIISKLVEEWQKLPVRSFGKEEIYDQTNSSFTGSQMGSFDYIKFKNFMQKELKLKSEEKQ